MVVDLVYMLPLPLIYHHSVTSAYNSQSDMLLTDSPKESLTK